MKKIIILILLSCTLVACSNTSSSSEQSLTTIYVSAAASMTEPLLQIKEQFEKENPTVELLYNFGGSGTLRKQIEQGAPADLFISASESDYLALEEKGFVDEGEAVLQNEIAFIVPEGSKISSMEQLKNNDGKIAIGTPEAVPAGTYAKQVLENVGLWDDLQSQFVFTKDVRQVLTLVKEGSVDGGFVYVSDAQDEKVKIAEMVDSSLHDPIYYYVALIHTDLENDTEKSQMVNRFYAYLFDENNMDTYQQFGFDLIKDTNEIR